MESDSDKDRLREAVRIMDLPEGLVGELRSGISSDAEIAGVLEAFLLSIRPNAGRQWLENPIPALDGETPAHLMRARRADEVRDGLMRLAHGIPI